MKLTTVLTMMLGAGLSSCVKPTSNAVEESPPAHELKEQVSYASDLVSEKDHRIDVVSMEEVFMLYHSEKALFIDTRPPVFFKFGHIKGACNVPLKYFSQRFGEAVPLLDQAVKDGKELVVYCANEKCKDSHRMSKLLAEAGYEARVFVGGWEMWKRVGL